MKRVAAPRRRGGWARTAAIVESAVVVAGWLVFAFVVSGGRRVMAYDAFRDMAYAHGILAGGLGRDPTFAGMPA